ncbi:hypothetical protein [Streptomyces sp. CBMA29]|uniref:hypothetical protein n=1 Tax=Streptomyces sp. CBMA29 TaxID=1896314 RepID=UPI001661CECE|nr:hypothetical protein [Streptomyces sp. CBMA29]
MTPPPPPPPPPPSHRPRLPARRPYGSVRLPADLPAGLLTGPAAARPGPGVAAPTGWYARRVRLPPLSIAALRSGRRYG